ncbi:SAM-dependent methyltransferase [Vannielia litorea]|uniref:SAM-dependent methyltransferase n=1 Tax=Vannielia litorea TaxID=1217970 RepID=UPI001C94D45F|nr:cyclopropane-fatty-acyl-phospholipid synthase family protein [Vannielia litorea]MBY6049676.1 cyclopropane-fatty-acyl-phospholipid synthase family protein [Vannielia litorea]MBY6077090.1 cyclopropane-fatty-acyl-phospholipid synthase family protein [Vannielia litorea]
MLFLTNRVKREFLDTCESIARGSLTLRTPEGEVLHFGSGQPEAELHLHDWSVVTALAARGDIGFGETYVEGLWDSPDIAAFIHFACLNLTEVEAFAYPSFWATLRYRLVDTLLRANTPRQAARNIRSHYDVGNEFYQLWLDESMTYSSALYAEGETDLQRAQHRKYDRILDRLSGHGDRVLEIGCGWGGFAERAADRGHNVKGLTISPAQKGYADARLDGRAEIVLQDYRHERGTYDNIVSIEMIEAVGQRYWPQYFATLKQSLSEQGRAVIQAITVPDSYFDIYRKSSDYIRHYTFPGGMLLSPGQIAKQAQAAGLRVVESFDFGTDYARTCATWADRMQENRGKIMQLGHGERFLRTWHYYLAICAGAFTAGQTSVSQVELAHA